MSVDRSVLVVGAGPTGLVLAIELARRGVGVRIVEKASSPSPASRAKGLQPRTLEIFHAIGIEEALLAAGGRFPRWRSYSGTTLRWEKSIFELIGQGEPVADPATPYPETWMVPQSQTETVLRQRLGSLNVEVEFGIEFLGLTQDEQGVVATLIDAAGPTQSRYDYVIGADGAGSAVRKALAIPFQGETREDERFIIADVEATSLDHAYWHNWSIDGDPIRRISMCPLPGTAYFQMVAPLDPHLPAPDLTLGTLQQLFDERAGRRNIALQNLAWITLHRTNLRLAERYRDGAVFLAGDAAHSPPQSGGQGLNISVQDAANLGWKLAATMKGAPAALLDSYEAERRPFAAGKLGVLTDATRQTEIQGDIFHLALHYRDSPISRETRQKPEGVRAGDRAPDTVIYNEAGDAIRLFDALREPGWILLAFSRKSADLCAAILKQYGTLISLGLTGPDASSDTHTTYGVPVGEDTILLVRPDGYVGFAADEEISDRLREYLADVVGPPDA